MADAAELRHWGHICVTDETSPSGCTCQEHGHALREVERLMADLAAATARADGLALANAELVAAFAEVFEYTKRLEGASAAYFISRSYARRPDPPSVSSEHIDAILARPSDARGAELLEALRSIAEEDLSDPDYLGDVANRVVRNARRALAGGGNGE